MGELLVVPDTADTRVPSSHGTRYDDETRFGVASAMILPIARRESHRVSEYGGTVPNSADLLKRIHQAAHPALSCSPSEQGQVPTYPSGNGMRYRSISDYLCTIIAL